MQFDRKISFFFTRELLLKNVCKSVENYCRVFFFLVSRTKYFEINNNNCGLPFAKIHLYIYIYTTYINYSNLNCLIRTRLIFNKNVQCMWQIPKWKP